MVKLTLFAVVAIAVMIYVDYKVNNDFKVHAGKDHGFGYRLEYHIYLTVFFFVLMCKRPIWIILLAPIGFITAYIAVAVALFGFSWLADMFDNSGNFYQVTACVISVAMFYLLENLYHKLMTKKTSAV